MRDNYDDIMGMEYPFPGKCPGNRQPMPVEERAKIFGSFAALKGHEDEIDKRRVEVEDLVNNHTIEREAFYEDI